MIDLNAFTEYTQAAARLVPANRVFGRKVFIHHVWAMGRFAYTYEMDLDTFKATLADAVQRRLIDLSRCDLPEAFDPFDVRRSQTLTANGAEFNFIRMS